MGRLRTAVTQLQFRLIDSPLRPIFGRNTVILHYWAPRAGRQVSVPLHAVTHPEGWVVAVMYSDSKRWWRAFRKPVRASLDVRGTRTPVVGVVTTGQAREHAHRAYVAQVPWSRFITDDTPLLVFSRTQDEEPGQP